MKKPSSANHVANLPRAKTLPTFATEAQALSYVLTHWGDHFTGLTARLAAITVFGFQETLRSLPAPNRIAFVKSILPVLTSRSGTITVASRAHVYLDLARAVLAEVGGTENEGIDPTPA